MKKILAVDIGNTNITMGLFRNGRLVSKTKTPTHSYSLYKNALRRFDMDRTVICSVVPVALARFVRSLGKIGKRDLVIVGRDAKVPIRNMYRKKGEVGQDRLVNAFAVRAIYGAPAVVIDFGTAVTFDIVSKKGEYLGGLIMPGIGISLASLYERTALLPRVELKAARYIIGKDTVNSMRGGILFGYGAMCDGLTAQYKRAFGSNLKVIATGGNARLIKRYTKAIQVVDEDLTLKGLYLISQA